MKTGARPGDNLYTSSVIALDIDTGKLKFYHQELPHDNWDFDSAIGEFVQIDRDGKQLMVHPNKSGYIFVYDRADAKLENVWSIVKASNFVKSIDPKTGELWCSVNERDGLGDNLVPDYITHVQEGGFYGWPWWYMGPNQDPRHKGKHPELKDKVITPDVLLQPHTWGDLSQGLAGIDAAQAAGLLGCATQSRHVHCRKRWPVRRSGSDRGPY